MRSRQIYFRIYIVKIRVARVVSAEAEARVSDLIRCGARPSSTWKRSSIWALLKRRFAASELPSSESLVLLFALDDPKVDVVVVVEASPSPVPLWLSIWEEVLKKSTAAMI